MRNDRNEQMRSLGVAIVRLRDVTNYPGDVADALSRIVSAAEVAEAARQWRINNADLEDLSPSVFLWCRDVECEAGKRV